MATPRTIVRRLRAYMRRTGKSATAVGLSIARNTSLLRRLESGQVTQRTLEHVERWLNRRRRRRA